MAYDLEEQEQIDTLKAWWKKYGNLITWLLVLVLAGYSGWTYWMRTQQGDADKAGELYGEMQKAVTAKDTAKVQRAAADIQDKFGKTIYGPMSALSAAKFAFDANDLKSAKVQLQWIISNNDNEEYKAIAKVRLAGIFLDEKSYDDGLKLLTGDFPPAFESMAADRKGDILVAQNKILEARAAYQLALDKMDAKNPTRQLIQIKLDAIGGTVNKAAA